MTYVKLDNGWPEHPKVVGLSDTARVLYVNSLCYAQRGLTDGAIPLAAVRLVHLRARERHVQELLDAGLWETADGGYRIHDYLRHQRSRAQVDEIRAATAQRLTRWRAEKRKSNAVTPTVTNDHVTHDVTLPETDTDTETETDQETTSLDDRRRRPKPVDEAFVLDMIGRYGAALGGDEVVREELEKARGHKSWEGWRDKRAGLRNWLQNAVRFREQHSANGTGPKPGQSDADYYLGGPLGQQVKAQVEKRSKAKEAT